MEKLRTYLEGKHKGDFARKLGISPTYLSMITSPRIGRRPSFDLMLKIEKQTDGFVDLKSWSPSAGVSSDVSQLDSRVLADHADGSGSAPDQGAR